ncbi:MAG: hypothetical protein HY778_11865 [Betaproteobacteria bacterium]|nr:hypothetical protein [Betaproteobacteria bacterium]
MDKDAIFHKTAKGQEEVRTRAHRLPARERSLLILVDGRNAVGELLQRTAAFMDGESFLADLLAQGFIERLVVTEGAEVIKADRHSPTPPGEQARQETAEPLAAVKAYAARFVIDHLGPDADTLARRVEECHDREQLIQALERCHEALRLTLGRRQADAFWNGALSLLGGDGNA